MRSAPRTRLAAVAAQVLALSLATSGPARAQLTVFDPANHVENALQTAHQLQSLTNEAQMLINQARELAASPYSHLLETSQALKDIGDLAASVRGSRTLRNVRSIYIKNFEAQVADDQIVSYRINAKITFELEEGR